MAEITNINIGVQIPEPRRNEPAQPAVTEQTRLTSDTAPLSQQSEAATTSVNFDEEQGSPLEQVARAIEDIIPEDSNTRLRIDRDEETGRFIYKNIDTESGEVVSQFPLESILDIVSQFRDLEGLILDNEA